MAYAGSIARRYDPSPAHVYWGLLVLVAFVPLPLASNRLWAWSLLAALVGILFALWALHALRRGEPGGVPPHRHAPATTLYGLAIVWFLIQASGWTPAAWHHPLWAESAAVLGLAETGGAISLNPAASVDGAMRFLAYGGVFWLAMQTCRSQRRARRALWVIVVAGAAYATYGLAVQFSGTNTILWFDKWAYGDVVTATFVNRNSYATYTGLIILAALCLLTRYAEMAAGVSTSSRKGLLYILTDAGVQLYLLIAVLFVLTSALLLTGSRGGTFATGFGVVAFLIGLTFYKRRDARRTVVYAGVIMIAGAVILGISGREVASRLTEASDDLAGRGQVWALTREAIVERPMLGTGLNTFAQVFLMKRDERFSHRAHPFARAHNGYHELVLEGGVIGAVLVFGALGWLALWCVYGIVMRHAEGIYPCLGLAALTLVGFHAWIDFSLQIPAVAVTFAAMLGVACAQSNRHADATGRTVPRRPAIADTP